MAASVCCVGLFQWSTLQTLNGVNSKIENSLELRERTRRKSAELEIASKVPTFGLNNVYANLTFLKFLQYFGDDKVRSVEGYELVPDFFESIISHDPYYRSFYLFLSGSGSIYAASPQESITIIDKGLKNLSPNQPSDSYYIWRYKGVDELLFLGDGKSAQESFETAADWAKESSDINSDMFERLSRQTAQHLSVNPLSMSAQVNAWSSVLTTALDNNTRAHAVSQIEELGGSVSFSKEGGIKIEFANKSKSNPES